MRVSIAATRTEARAFVGAVADIETARLAWNGIFTEILAAHGLPELENGTSVSSRPGPNGSFLIEWDAPDAVVSPGGADAGDSTPPNGNGSHGDKIIQLVPSPVGG